MAISPLATAKPSAPSALAPAPRENSSLRDSLSAAAVAKFDEGTQFYDQGHFALAREAFLAAYAAGGDARILYDVAVCEKAMGHYARAILTLRRSLDHESSAPADYATRAKESIAALARYVAVVSVEASVDGAALTVDGEPLADNPVPLEPGRHIFEAAHEGYERATESVIVKAGDVQRVFIHLADSKKVPDVATATARLRVTARDHRDLITLDGIQIVQSGVTVDVPPGEHRLVVSQGDGTAKTFDVIVRANELRDLSLSVDERSGSVSAWWFIVGGAVLAAGATAATVALVTRPTRFEGSHAGTLNPYVVSASFHGVFR